MRIKRLLKRAQNGDSDAFATLFQLYAPALWRHACSVLRNEENASDALQDAAIKAWQAIPNFDGRSKLNTWLTRILLNCCYDILRSCKAEFVAEIDDDYAARGVTHSAEGRDTRSSTINKISIDQTLDKLSDEDKQIITLFYFADMPLRQIAVLLDITEQTVRTRLSRARARFRALYIAEQNDFIN